MSHVRPIALFMMFQLRMFCSEREVGHVLRGEEPGEVVALAGGLQLWRPLYPPRASPCPVLVSSICAES